MPNNSVTVSVCMITYNHAPFITQAIESVLSQRTEYRVELVIADDASSDGSQEIIENILGRHNGDVAIKFLKNQKNKGMMPNFFDALVACTGKYIALCEGDDYWIDKEKLQKQVTFLEQFPSYGLCCHGVKVYSENEQQFVNAGVAHPGPKIATLVDLAKGNFIHTPSVVLKNDFELPGWFKEARLGDITLYMIQIGRRKIASWDETMAVYRLHSGSEWSSKNQIERITKTIENIDLLLHSMQFDKPVYLQLLATRLKFEQDIRRLTGKRKGLLLRCKKMKYRLLLRKEKILGLLRSAGH